MKEEEMHHEHGGEHGKPQPHLIEVRINDTEKKITGGHRVVAELKKLLGVPADYELDRIVGREIKAQKDDQTIEVHAGERFISHVRKGGSSS